MAGLTLPPERAHDLEDTVGNALMNVLGRPRLWRAAACVERSECAAALEDIVRANHSMRTYYVDKRNPRPADIREQLAPG